MKAKGGIRMTRGKACKEFDIAPDTLDKRLAQASIIPDDDGLYTIPQICVAVYGDYDGERTRLTKENADIAALKKAEMLRELLPAALVERVWNGVMTDLRQKISVCDIPDLSKQEILADLQNVPIDDYFTITTSSDQETAEGQPAAT